MRIARTPAGGHHRRQAMRKFAPVLLTGVMAASFSMAAFAQNTRDNIHYNIHQKGEQNSSQTGDGNQSSQVYGSGNQTTQQGADSQSNTVQGSGNTTSNTEQSGTQNQSAVGSG